MPGPFVLRESQPKAFSLRPRETWEKDFSLEINTRLAKRKECATNGQNKSGTVQWSDRAQCPGAATCRSPFGFPFPKSMNVTFSEWPECWKWTWVRKFPLECYLDLVHTLTHRVHALIYTYIHSLASLTGISIHLLIHAVVWRGFQFWCAHCSGWVPSSTTLTLWGDLIEAIEDSVDWEIIPILSSPKSCSDLLQERE